MTLCLLLTVVPSAMAESATPTPTIGSSASPSDVVDVIAAVDEALLGNASEVEPSNRGEFAIDASIGKAEITVPTDPADGITIESERGALTVELPFAAEASEATSGGPGVVLYDNQNGSTTVPIANDDGSVQVNTVISSPDAPTAYTYSFDLPSSTVVERVGGAILFMADGELVGGLAPAWAKDAAGRDVPTRYVIDGSTVTQIVDHNDNYAYPVFADPWIGQWLFKSFQVNRKGKYKNKNIYSGVLSNWGWAVYTGTAQGGGALGLAAGYKIVRSIGWDEWKSKLVGANPAITLEQQYVCHARFGYAFWLAGFHWDLEAARPKKSNWTDDPYSHKCNW